jgi:hypothetical protein
MLISEVGRSAFPDFWAASVPPADLSLVIFYFFFF